MAGIHGLQQIEGFGSAHLADDDAVGTHTQAVLDEIAHGDLALAFEVRRPRLKPDHMRLLQLQLGRVLAGDDALVVVDIAGHAVEQGRLARTGAAGNDDVAAHAADDGEQGAALGRDRAEFHELIERQPVALEFADGEGRTVEGERRGDHIDAAAVGQARVADRARFVDAAADLAHDALADIHQLRIVGEADIGGLDLALDLDIGRVGAIHHDVGDFVAGEQRLERPVAENVVADVL